MILADKIIEARKKNGWSQEELAQMLSVSRQSVSKWESAQSVPDLNRIIQLADILGVSTDYLLKDEIEEIYNTAESVTACDISSGSRKISMEEAVEFLRIKERSSSIIALAVLLCVISPAPVLALSGLAEDGIIVISEDIAGGIGITVILLLIATAVFIFILSGKWLEKYAFIEKHEIETAYGVSGLVREKKKEFSSEYHINVGLGAAICIVSAIPLIICGTMNLATYILTSMAALMLTAISIAVYMIVRVSIINGSYDQLIQEGDYTSRNKKNAPIISKISGIYWLLTVGLYLTVSFVKFSWNTSWIIWPISGVLFAVVISVVKIIIKSDN